MKLALIGLMIFMVGCSTPYQKMGMSMGGFTEYQISEDSYRVSFKGTPHDVEWIVTDYTMLRSAELTIEKGFSYFTLIHSEDTSMRVVGSIFPATTNYIKCFKEKPDIKGIIYDARTVYKTLGGRYGVEKPAA